jgi:hypothetical protein
MKDEALKLAMEPRARLMTYIGKGPYPKQGYTVARTYEECPENQYPDAWSEGEKLYTTTPAQPAAPPREHEHALERALTRLQKRYSELEAKVGAQPAVPLTDDVLQKIIANLEPLLDAKNQSWADAEKMLHEITAAAPEKGKP